MVGLWLCWGSSFPAIRVMVTTLPPLLASGAVFLLAGVALAATRPGVLRGLSRRQLGTAAGTGVCLLGAQGAVAVAERHVFVSTAALLVAVVPLWVVVLRVAVGERPTRAGVARVLAGFAGVILVVVTSSSGGGWSAWCLVVAAAAIGWAAGTLWASRAAALPGPRPATVVQLVAGGLLLLVLGVVTGEPTRLAVASASPNSWIAWAYLVLIDSVTGFALYNWLLRTTPIALVSTTPMPFPWLHTWSGCLFSANRFIPGSCLARQSSS
jgi:drug/metabolite transporter (DMT)-like permease